MAARPLRRTFRWAAATIGVVVLLFVLVIAALQTAPVQQQLAVWISRLASTPGRLSVEVRGLEGSIPTRFSIAEILVSDPEGLWLRVTGIEAQGSPSDLMRGSIHLERVTAGAVVRARRPVEAAARR